MLSDGSADATPENTPQWHTPSLARRMACWFYEGMLLFGVVFIAGYLFGTLSQTKHALDNRHGLQAFLFLVFAIYFTWFWHKGQTLAMKTWHIKVLDTSGKALTQSRALLRYVLCWVWFLPPIMAATPFQLPAPVIGMLVVVWIFVWAFASRFQLQRQYWHDVWAGTQLVDVQKKP
jgi:uncharacterized RDD family membrane protein YckC